MMEKTYHISSLGDAALLIQFSNCIDDVTNRKVLDIFQRLQHFSPHINEVVPSYASLAVYYDVVALHTKEKTAFENLKELLLPLLNEMGEAEKRTGRNIQIPVCYNHHFAPDLKELAAQKKLSVEDVVRLHTALAYRVYMIGFLPGFPYMGKVDERIATPRRNSPRTLVPAGSVGIAGEQTGIYPLASPGGWNIIGRTPVLLFDKNAEMPVLLQPGDNVTFYSISENEFENYQSRTA